MTEVNDEAFDIIKQDNARLEREEKVTEEDIDFVIITMCKEAKHDRPSIEQLLFGMGATFTKIPMPHNLNSKNSGAGKSYLLNLVGDYFPSKHVMILAGASAKALLHREGVMVIKNEETGELEEVEPKVEKLENELDELDPSSNENKPRIKEIKKEIKYLQKHQQKLIDLDFIIIIIQDTPQDEFLIALMSLSSQDSKKDQEYIFADKSHSGKIVQGSNIIRGMPSLFTTRVVDDTKHVRFEEVNRRSINVTPNVSREKIESANELTSMRYGLLPEEYDEQVVSREDKERAKTILTKIVEKLIAHTKLLGPKQSGVRIPFQSAIAHAMPSDDVWAMTVADRTIRYLSIITKFRMDSRPRFVHKETGAFYPISTFNDLKKTLTLMERGGSNIRPYIAAWYNSVFIPVFKTLKSPKPIKAGDGTIVDIEDRIGVTTEDLAHETKEILKVPKPTGEEIRKKYLDPLVNQGVINCEKSKDDKRKNIYYPADEDNTNIFSMFANSQDLTLTVTDPFFYPSINVLEELLGRRKKYNAEEGVEKNKILDIYKLVDADGTEITPEELLSKYFQNPETCFTKSYSEVNPIANIVYTTQILNKIK